MMKAKPDSDSLVFECDFEEPPEKVWRALTEPRLLEAWLMGKENQGTEPVEGQPASRQPDLDGADRSARPVSSNDYEVLSAEPHRLVSYRWRDRERGVGDSGDREVHSVVTFELAPSPTGGTHLRLTHGGFRIVSAAPSMAVARARPLTSARRARPRRTGMPSLAAPYSLRRAA